MVHCLYLPAAEILLATYVNLPDVCVNTVLEIEPDSEGLSDTVMAQSLSDLCADRISDDVSGKSLPCRWQGQRSQPDGGACGRREAPGTTVRREMPFQWLQYLLCTASMSALQLEEFAAV